MSDRKTKWEMLNESLGFPLGVKSAASLGLSGGFNTLEEGKKKKKMDLGVEVPADDEAGDDADLDSDDAGDLGDDAGGCSCGHSDKGGEEGPGPMMCKKCKKMKKGMKKKMKNEDMFSGYEHTLFQQTSEVGSDDYKKEFWRSLNSAFADPRKRNFGGVNLDEEVVFQPEEEVEAQAQQPKPGQPGFAPMSRIGVTTKAETPVSSWEQGWSQIAEAMQGLQAKVDAISKKKR